jgi:hypothetical protein
MQVPIPTFGFTLVRGSMPGFTLARKEKKKLWFSVAVCMPTVVCE